MHIVAGCSYSLRTLGQARALSLISGFLHLPASGVSPPTQLLPVNTCPAPKLWWLHMWQLRSHLGGRHSVKVGSVTVWPSHTELSWERQGVSGLQGGPLAAGTFQPLLSGMQCVLLLLRSWLMDQEAWTWAFLAHDSLLDTLVSSNSAWSIFPKLQISTETRILRPGNSIYIYLTWKLHF